MLSTAQLRGLAKEFEAVAPGRGAALRELLEKEKALQSSGAQLATRKLKLAADGKDAAVRIPNEVRTSAVSLLRLPVEALESLA